MPIDLSIHEIIELLAAKAKKLEDQAADLERKLAATRRRAAALTGPADTDEYGAICLDCGHIGPADESCGGCGVQSRLEPG